MVKPLFSNDSQPPSPATSASTPKPLFGADPAPAQTPTPVPLLAPTPAPPRATPSPQPLFGNEPPAPPAPQPAPAPRPAPSPLFAPGSAGEPPPVKPVVRQPAPVFRDAEQIWLEKLDLESKRLFPDTTASVYAQMTVVWRALLPFSERAVLELAESELRSAAQLSSRIASLAQSAAQLRIAEQLDALAQAMDGSSRGWFASLRREDPASLVAGIQSAEPRLKALFDDLDEVEQSLPPLRERLEAFHQGVACLATIGEQEWRVSLEAKAQLLHHALYNLDLNRAHCTQQRQLFAAWGENIQRLVYLAYPSWKMAKH
ncbi:hypothetical protein [Chitinimonas lacunae]|uniref:Uncharacterized protein n=1 Tax=Chitinimonas lacunae TaxID=1963018 RepID=A0ABV8MMW4_9NEIS